MSTESLTVLTEGCGCEVISELEQDDDDDDDADSDSDAARSWRQAEE